jgi:UDP-glucose 4-epimerase
MNALEQAVLGVLLDHHPGLLSLEEVVRHIAPDPSDFDDRDNVLVATRALVQRGLAHRLEEFIFASAAAVYFERLKSA